MKSKVLSLTVATITAVSLMVPATSVFAKTNTHRSKAKVEIKAIKDQATYISNAQSFLTKATNLLSTSSFIAAEEALKNAEKNIKLVTDVTTKASLTTNSTTLHEQINVAAAKNYMDKATTQLETGNFKEADILVSKANAFVAKIQDATTKSADLVAIATMLEKINTELAKYNIDKATPLINAANFKEADKYLTKAYYYVQKIQDTTTTSTLTTSINTLQEQVNVALAKYYLDKATSQIQANEMKSARNSLTLANFFIEKIQDSTTKATYTTTSAELQQKLPTIIYKYKK